MDVSRWGAASLPESDCGLEIRMLDFQPVATSFSARLILTETRPRRRKPNGDIGRLGYEYSSAEARTSDPVQRGARSI